MKRLLTGALLGAFLLYTALPAWTLVHRVSGLEQRRLYEQTVADLMLDSAAYKAKFVIKPNTIIALSHAAEGLENHLKDHPEDKAEATKALDQAVLHALDNTHYRKPFSQVKNLDRYGVYLSHLAIVLGIHRKVTGSERYAPTHRRVIAHMVRLIDADKMGQIPPFPQTEARWPADTLAALYAFQKYDEVEGTTLTPKRYERAMAAINSERGTDPASGLPYSELSRTLDYWKYPRGCALSWSTHYLSYLDPPEARRVWALYRPRFQVDLGLMSALREYDWGHHRKSDTDSGPILLGVGAAATGFGITGARSAGDHWTALKLTAGLGVGDMLATPVPILRKLAWDPLAVAIRFNGSAR